MNVRGHPPETYGRFTREILEVVGHCSFIWDIEVRCWGAIWDIIWSIIWDTTRDKIVRASQGGGTQISNTLRGILLDKERQAVLRKCLS